MALSLAFFAADFTLAHVLQTVLSLENTVAAVLVEVVKVYLFAFALSSHESLLIKDSSLTNSRPFP